MLKHISNKVMVIITAMLIIVGYAHSAIGSTRVEIPNGIYAEACPDGTYSSLIWGSHIQVGSVNFVRPPIALPGENILYLRNSCDSTGRLCGTGGTTDTAWYYNGSQWENRGLAFGTNACIFNAQGKVIFVQQAGTPTGALGNRYVNAQGQIVSSESTYADPQKQIFEYTERTFTVGQGPEDGCRVLEHDLLFTAHVLEEGACRFVNYNSNGGLNAIGISKLGDGKAVLYWLTDTEMVALPLVDSEPPPPLIEKCGDGIDNDKDGLIDENPPCLPEPQTTPNDAEIVVLTNQQHPLLLERNRHEDACRFTHLAALNLNKKDQDWGMLTKPPGQNGCDIKGGRYAVDAVIYKQTQQVVDIISGAGDEVPTITAWAHQPKRPDNHWALPPDAEEPPPPVDDLEERVEALERQVKQLSTDLAVLTVRHNQLQSQVDSLPPPSSGGVSEAEVIKMITSAFAAARVAGSTGRSIGHTHGVNLQVFLEWNGLVR